METPRSFLIPFLAGALVTLGVSALQRTPVFPPAYAAGASGDGGVYMVTNNGSQAQGRDLLFVVESNEGSKRLAIYEYKGDQLKLGAVRNLDYDLHFSEWSKKGNAQSPSVKELKEEVEKEENKTKKSGRSRSK